MVFEYLEIDIRNKTEMLGEKEEEKMKNGRVCAENSYHQRSLGSYFVDKGQRAGRCSLS